MISLLSATCYFVGSVAVGCRAMLFNVSHIIVRPAFFAFFSPSGLPENLPERPLLSSPFCQTCSFVLFRFDSIKALTMKLNFLITRNLLSIESKNNSPHGTILSVPYGYPSLTSVENTEFSIWSCLVLSNKCPRASLSGIIRGSSFSGRSEIAMTVFPIEEYNKKSAACSPRTCPLHKVEKFQ